MADSSGSAENVPWRPMKPKETVQGDAMGKRISHIQFGTIGPPEMARLSEFEVVSDKGYEQPSRTPVAGGVLDRRLGVSDKHSTCETCGARLQECPGHYGHIKLALPVFHIGYLKSTMAILSSICKTCSRVLLPPAERMRMQRQLSHPIFSHDYVRRTAAVKRVVERCKKVRECPYCQALNGQVKKVGCLRLIHEKYREKDKSERAFASRREFHSSFEHAMQASKGSFEQAQHSGADIRLLLPKCQDDLNALRVRALFRGEHAATPYPHPAPTPHPAPPEPSSWWG